MLGVALVEEMACCIMTGLGSVPITWLKWGAREREIRPWPQPRSRRVVLGWERW